MRSFTGTAGTVPTNYSANSNNNCIYVAPGLNAVSYVENTYTGNSTNAIPANCYDLTTFKAFMTGGRETNSISEIPPFVATSTPTDLHLNTALASGCWDAGTSGVSASVAVDIR
jgi:hypothetical protein